MINYNFNYIFLCGAGHSGTTLALAILDSHPSIASIPHETGVFIRNKDNDDKVRKVINGWPDKFFNFQGLEGVTYIAEKTPVHVRFITKILELYPESRIIIMVRDGRDASISENKRINDFKKAVSNWKFLTTVAMPFFSHPNVLSIKYEELVTNTEAECKRICHFLNLEFDIRMLVHHETKRLWWDKEVRKADFNAPLVGGNHKKNRNWQINQPIFDGRGHWKKEMLEEQKEVFKKIAGDLLIQLGYSSDNSW